MYDHIHDHIHDQARPSSPSEQLRRVLRTVSGSMDEQTVAAPADADSSSAGPVWAQLAIAGTVFGI